MNRLWLPVFVLGTIACGMACRPQDPPAKPAGTPAPAVIAADNDFGFRIFAQFAGKEENVFVSPASIALALQMTYNGAAGDTATDMAKALGLGQIQLAELNEANRSLHELLSVNDPTLEVAIANSIWARKDLTFKQDFLDRNRDYYGAEVTNLDFGSAEAVQAINQWVSKHTHDKIPTIVKQIDRDMAMYLINAVYFKASWQDPFDKKNTKEQPFHLAGGGTSPCQMMTRADTMSHATGAGWEGVELPYSRGRMSMYVFLPAQGSKLTDLMQTLTAQTWDATLASFKHERGSVSLPKFKVEWEANLNSALIALGMGSAFDPQTADFTGMGGAKGFLYIGEVKHKTYIDVNEVGTEAAAVTSVGMKATGMPAGEPFHLVADRPFFYVIRDNKSKAILFMGLLYKP